MIAGFVVGLTSVGSGTFFGLVLVLSGIKLVELPAANTIVARVLAQRRVIAAATD